ncbi:hypothetical protein NQ318_017735 [Aromia moschata]|uniref:AMP-dependent synthetase/ligase domain-containing protein n=1 Tax=Aromia moschata TaxID=1265417 RepID=A0AAV8XR12_9CUCU|nr:hypothetical protein NQ318_017735 [Aromia moschata]
MLVPTSNGEGMVDTHRAPVCVQGFIQRSAPGSPRFAASDRSSHRPCIPSARAYLRIRGIFRVVFFHAVRAVKPEPPCPLKGHIPDEVRESLSSQAVYENGKARQHTYAELDRITNKLARTIRHAIVSYNLPRNADGDIIVAVNMHPSDQLVMALLAIWKAGAAYLPLGPRLSRGENRTHRQGGQTCDDSSSYMDTYKLSFEELVQQSANQPQDILNDDERVHHIKDDLAIVLYTSGSTGIPKADSLYSSTENVCVFKTALTFVDSVSEIWGPLLSGRCLLVVPKGLTKDPEKLVGLLEQYKIERLVLVPSLLRSLLMFLELQKNKRALRNLKLWVCSGETLAVSLAQEFFEFFPENEHQLCNFYGSTEIMGDVTYHVITGLEQLRNQDKVPIGLPVDNTIIYLLDRDFRPVKAGDVGELFASGLNLAAGYVNGRDPEKFLDNPLAIDPTYAKLYRTGDFARLEKGTLMYEGRTDSQVKIRGHRVDLAEVEKAVNSVDGVGKAVVLCYQPGEINQALLAFVTTHKPMNESQIEAMLKDKLTSYMVPQVVLLEAIPLAGDISGKVGISYEGVSSNAMEAARILFETIASVLNNAARSVISVNANFYEIGGNSLNSIYTISRLSEKGYHITELLKPEYKSAALDMITTSFYQKADLEQWIISYISEPDYDELVDALWEPLLEKNLSFIVKSETGKLVGVALNFDARDEPEVEITSKLTVIFEFLEFVEGPVRDTQLPPGKGTVLHSFMMATHSSLSPKENVAVMQFMEEEVVNLAKRRNFAGIFTTNTSPLTQQLGTDVHKYQTMLDYQVNEYVASDNTKPFGLAPDEQRAIVQWKPVV